jgi:hypothetical protein
VGCALELVTPPAEIQHTVVSAAHGIDRDIEIVRWKAVPDADVEDPAAGNLGTEVVQVRDSFSLSRDDRGATVKDGMSLIDRPDNLTELDHLGRWRRWLIEGGWWQPTGNEEGARTFSGQLPGCLARVEFAVKLRELIEFAACVAKDQARAGFLPSDRIERYDETMPENQPAPDNQRVDPQSLRIDEKPLDCASFLSVTSPEPITEADAHALPPRSADVLPILAGITLAEKGDARGERPRASLRRDSARASEESSESPDRLFAEKIP